MSWVGLPTKLTLTNLGYRMFGMEYPRIHTCGREEWKQDWAKVIYSHSPSDSVPNSTRRSGTRMTLDSFPELDLNGQKFFPCFPCKSVVHYGHTRYHWGLGESQPLSLTFEGTDDWRFFANITQEWEPQVLSFSF